MCYRPGRANSNADALSRAPVDSSDHREEDDAEVQVAQVSVEEEQQPMSEVAELQRADEVIVRCSCEDAELDDSVVSKVMLMERDRLVLLA